VLVSVPGTPQVKEAPIANAIPQTATIRWRTSSKVIAGRYICGTRRRGYVEFFML